MGGEVVLYNDYLSKISKRFKGLLDEIGANVNFDYGPEFEIGLCVALRAILPSRFGITRGWVVPATGSPPATTSSSTTGNGFRRSG